MTDAEAILVQFPHPGDEHNPPDDDLPWDVADHRRKSSSCQGTISTTNDTAT
jgi:hypothetical protein